MLLLNKLIECEVALKLHNGFELSGRGMPDRYLFTTLISYNFASKSRSIHGPFQRGVRQSLR